jgi:hypothetical protein
VFTHLHHHFACRLTPYADIEKDSRIWGLFSHFSFLFSFRENQTSYIELQKNKNRCSATLTNPFLNEKHQQTTRSKEKNQSVRRRKTTPHMDNSLCNHGLLYTPKEYRATKSKERKRR